MGNSMEIVIFPSNMTRVQALMDIYEHPKSSSRKILKLWFGNLALNARIPAKSWTPVVFDCNIIISIESRISIHPLYLKKTVLGYYVATLGWIKNIEFLCTKVEFCHVGIVQKSKTDKKTYVVGQKMRKPLMSVNVYHFIVTNCCWYSQMTSSMMFCSGSRRGRSPGTASISADGRFTPVVSNWLKTSILVSSGRHWKHSAILFKIGGHNTV